MMSRLRARPRFPFQSADCLTGVQPQGQLPLGPTIDSMSVHRECWSGNRRMPWVGPGPPVSNYLGCGASSVALTQIPPRTGWSACDGLRTGSVLGTAGGAGLAACSGSAVCLGQGRARTESPHRASLAGGRLTGAALLGCTSTDRPSRYRLGAQGEVRHDRGVRLCSLEQRHLSDSFSGSSREMSRVAESVLVS